MLLAGVALIDAVDRGILPGVLTRVQDDLGFSDSQAGVLGAVFVLASLVFVLPAGYFTDRVRRRTRLVAIVLLSWGAVSALNAAVGGYLQFLLVRAAMGSGEAFNNPASQSLLADYYPASQRGRTYAIHRVAPVVGTALGIGLGGAVGALLGWRAAFLVVGVPGSLLALGVWRLPEPARGESDGQVIVEGARGVAALVADVRRALQVPTLRAVMFGLGVTAGVLSGIGFWGVAFYERHTSLSGGAAAGIVGVLILLGAAAGTLVGGNLTDRLRDRVEGAPMLLAGATQAGAAVLFAATFAPVPLWIRLPGQLVAVVLTLAGFPALSAVTSEVVPASMRGIAFSVTGLLTAAAGAISPLLIGFLADQFPIGVRGHVKGNLAIAFLLVTPLILLGGLTVWRGRRHVAADMARARAGTGA